MKLLSNFTYRDAARRLALKCHHLCTALQQYEKRSIPDQMVQNRDNVFKSVTYYFFMVNFIDRS